VRRPRDAAAICSSGAPRGRASRERLGHREAEDVLEIVRHARRVAVAVLLEDLEAVLDAPVAQVVARRVQTRLLAHLADRRVAKGLGLVREAARDRLQKSCQPARCIISTCRSGVWITTSTERGIL